MKRINLLHLLILTSCVSVQLQKPLVLEKSKYYSLVVPSKPFVRMEQTGMDQYWRNAKNANSISLQTACSENYDPSFQDLSYQNIQGIDEIKKVVESKFDYNSRVGLKSEYEGLVDGISVVIKLVVFKKNNCSYVISYFGKKQSIESDLHTFNKFVNNFRVK
ncbi:MAG: hypothetical protein KDD37_01985 [Bdellovibrionales bacterium]|nr:hypothetical protein [Bdellovibrionales bacterium]